jgi:erythromycin esterase
MAQKIPGTRRAGLAALALLAAAPLGAADPPNLSGRWNTDIQGLQGIYLLLERGPRGEYAGIFTFPYESRRPMAVTGVELSGARVVLEFQSAGARFEGVVNEAAGEMIGLFTGRSGDLPMRFAKVVPRADPLAAWLKSNVIPIKAVTPGSGFDDLQPLKRVVGGARVVALGEATHGTREFFLWKHRLVEFLVAEMGFTVFAIEANYPEALAVNEYVLHGRGDARQALAGLHFWTWNTEEVLGLIEWMRRWNADPAHARKVKFHGVDMQYPQEAAARVMAAIAARAPGEAERARAVLAPLTMAGVEGELPKKPREEMQRLAAALAGLAPLVEADAGARQHLRIAEQCVGRFAEAQALAGRDRYMAENAAWILDREGPEARMIVWAHNGHVAADPGAGFFLSMGAHLRQRLGQALLVMGFSFDQGSFRAVETGAGLREFTVGPAVDGSLDRTLAGVGLPYLALDMRAAARAEPAASWLSQPLKMRSIGALFSSAIEPMSYYARFIQRDFDVILFVARTTASHGLAAPAAPGVAGAVGPAPRAGGAGGQALPPALRLLQGF